MLIGTHAAHLAVKYWQSLLTLWVTGVFLVFPLEAAGTVRKSAGLFVAAGVFGLVCIALFVRSIVLLHRVNRAIREHVRAAFGFTPRIAPNFRNARSAYGWLRLDQLYQAAGVRVTRLGSSKAYGTRWSRPRLIDDMEKRLVAAGRPLPSDLPVPKGWQPRSG